MAMNFLSRLLKEPGKVGVFNFHPKCKKVKLIHLCFTDDLFIFTHGDLDSILGIRGLPAVLYFIFG